MIGRQQCDVPMTVAMALFLITIRADPIAQGRRADFEWELSLRRERWPRILGRPYKELDFPVLLEGPNQDEIR